VQSGALGFLSAGEESERDTSLDSLPLSGLITSSFRLLDERLRDEEGLQAQASNVRTVGLAPTSLHGFKPSNNPGAQALVAGKFFTQASPRIAGYKPTYYATHRGSEFPLQEVRNDHNLTRLSNESAVPVRTKDLQAFEGLGKAALSILNYEDWTLAALCSSLGAPGGELPSQKPGNDVRPSGPDHD
jgi:hypothetical protein